jgi:hypothetical protein
VCVKMDFVTCMLEQMEVNECVKRLILECSLLLEVVFEYTCRELKIIAFNHVAINNFSSLSL